MDQREHTKGDYWKIIGLRVILSLTGVMLIAIFLGNVRLINLVKGGVFVIVIIQVITFLLLYDYGEKLSRRLKKLEELLEEMQTSRIRKSSR